MGKDVEDTGFQDEPGEDEADEEEEQEDVDE